MDTTAQTYHLTTPNSPLSPRICRDTVAILLTTSGHAPHLADTARTLVSEVVTNAVRHTSTPTIHLTTSVTGDGVRVAVYDDGPLPDLAPPTPTAGDENGRGLLLVQALAQAWGAGPARDPGGPGKHIWFELPADPPTTLHA
ncbi:ATP-binding protein [Streptomyces sp. NPDC088812]|uniref:ATP-binding protein n=1 Tax=Streptomyces sp. NPDC088812 TaxID=3365905 RepID=UPI00380E30C0